MKPDRKGRSKGVVGFTLLTHHLQDSAAWRSLSPQARAVYLEIARLYNGKNNGFLGLGVRAAAERANVNKDTAGRCFKDLIARGLIAVGSPGKFATKARLASEWRLTVYPCHRTGGLPTKEFQLWRPDAVKPSPPVSDNKTPHSGQRAKLSLVPVPSFRTGAVA